jgi:hypothetical protein
MIHRRFFQSSICIIIFVQFLIITSSCGTVEIGIEQTSTPNIQLTEFTSFLTTENANLATRIASPALVSTDSANSPVPSRASPTPLSAAFVNLSFSPVPDETHARQFYTEGTPRIFALWDYRGMQEEMLVRREWKRDNEDWIIQEEPWAYSKYGNQGTVSDIFVFDNQDGLEPGEYSLSLYIDGVAQNLEQESSSINQSSFWVFKSEINAPVASPDKSHSAIVRFGGNLFIEYPDGDVREIAQVQEVSAMEWFPDGTNLLLVERDRSKQIEPSRDTGIIHRMYIIDVETLAQNILGTAGENFHSPIISPTGEYVSVLSGDHHQDGCTGSPNLAILELDTDLRRQAVYLMSSFIGLDFPNDDQSAIISEENQTRVWENDNQLLVYLKWLCKPSNQSPDGLYLFDLTNKTAIPKG